MSKVKEKHPDFSVSMYKNKEALFLDRSSYWEDEALRLEGVVKAHETYILYLENNLGIKG